MKAVRVHARGGPEQLAYEDAPKPAPDAGEALVRVHAAGVTPSELSWASAYTTREGLDRLPAIPGHELSGVVEAVAPDAAHVVAGEAVYALIDFWRDGADAEYVAARAADLAPKPRSLDHVHAAAATLSGLTAWQALFDHGGLSRGQRVLIHGAAGGVGSFAVQFARWCGAEVIATASPRNKDFVRSLGADEVIDYTAARFEDIVRDADMVVDTIGGETLERSWGVLRTGGVLVTLVGTIAAEEAARRGVRGVSFIVAPSRAELVEIARLIDAGRVRVIVTDILRLRRAREAFERGLKGHNRGKIALSVIGDAV